MLHPAQVVAAFEAVPASAADVTAPVAAVHSHGEHDPRAVRLWRPVFVCAEEDEDDEFEQSALHGDTLRPNGKINAARIERHNAMMHPSRTVNSPESLISASMIQGATAPSS